MNFLFASILLVLVHLSTCSNNDLDSNYFKINISNVPVKLTQVTGDHMEVFSKYGQQFTCLLPKIVIPVKSLQSSPNNTSIDVSRVMAELNSTDCLLHPVGWWTYKLCIGKSVSHYHEENEQEVSVSVLGRYSSDFDWNKASPHDNQMKQRYHSQYYRNGDICDVTSSPRTVEVQFICHAGHSIVFIDVSEPETCSYVLKVGVPDLCEIELLKPQVEAEASPINCFPALSDIDHIAYTEAERTKQLEKKNAEELISFQNLMKNLPSMRKAMKRKVLWLGRTYRNRQKLNHYLTARRFIHRTILFLNEVESNFDNVKTSSSEEFELSSKLRTLNRKSNMKLSSGRLSTLTEKAIRAVKFSLEKSKFANDDFLFQKRTLVIASALITHIRRNFEWHVENGLNPRLPNMLKGFLDVLKNLKKLRGSRHWNRLENVLLKRTILKPHLRPKLSLMILENESGDLDDGRNLLDLLNITAIYSQKALLLAELTSGLKKVLNTGFDTLTTSDRSSNDNDLSSNLDLEHVEELVENALKSQENDLTSGEDSMVDAASVEDSIPNFSEIKKALRSSKLNSIVGKLAKNSRKKLNMRANLKKMGDGVYAFYITIGESDADAKQQAENEQNYAFRMNVQ